MPLKGNLMYLESGRRTFSWTTSAKSKAESSDLCYHLVYLICYATIFLEN